MKTMILSLLGLAAATSAQAAQTQRPVVLELFTSQGCSSCPPADALLGTLAREPGVLALSFHVHYWNYLGWPDPFSSEANTARQRNYAQALHQRSVFTPQLVVDGAYSAVGNNPQAVEAAIAQARQRQQAVTVAIREDAGKLAVHVDNGPAFSAGVYAVRYNRQSTTDVRAGENSGRSLTSVNNVLDIHKLGQWHGAGVDYTLDAPGNGEGIAILLQQDGLGPIAGAASYAKN